ncbi:MAG: tRNA adenosine(34) deaminase TadA [Acidobacteria bacterium]|nr:tRNA adenosine(34) deaminase TadA [Acidobacteriota bacterium]
MDQDMMAQALALARQGAEAGEVPMGAVVVVRGEVIGQGFNQPLGAQDPTAHAEIVALRQACRQAGNYRLPGATVYVTLEPCLMCVGAMVHARISRLVYGAADPKVGAVRLAAELADRHTLNHRFAVTGGVLGDEAGALLRDYFKIRRDRGGGSDV